MTDRKLLELAAKAAGPEIFGEPGCYFRRLSENHSMVSGWNPLTDDGDALRLAVRLGISLLPYPVYNETERHSVIAKQRRQGDILRKANPTVAMEVYNDDPYAATRRAIVRAAAEIGRSME